jgi:membrane protein
VPSPPRRRGKPGAETGIPRRRGRSRANGVNRGRAADRPGEIPPRGWKDILVRTYHSLSDDGVTALAAGVNYYILLALFPGITALVSIYGLVADPADIGEHLASLSGAIPSDAISIISGQLHFLASQDEKAPASRSSAASWFRCGAPTPR